MVLRPGFRICLLVCLFAALAAAQPGRVAVRGSVPPQVSAGADLGAVPPDFPLPNITFVLARTPAQQSALEQLLAAQQDPASPDYHRWLTPETYAERFGASADDLSKVTSWLAAQGFTVRYTARGRDFVSFSGTAAQAQSALGAPIHRYRVAGATHFANSTDISLPSEIAPLIGGILGLHDFHPHAPIKTLPPQYTDSDGLNYLVPDDFATIYDLSGLLMYGFDGAGQTIVIVGQSDIDAGDISDFRSSFGLPPLNLQMIPNGTYPGFTTDEVEADLDLEWAGAVARAASFLYVFSDDADYSAYYAIDNNLAPIISESYGLCEYVVASNRLGLYNYRVEAQKGSALGITWLASSGDSGAAGCDYDVPVATQGFGVNLPASIPEVTAVGGTEFNEGGGSYWSATNGPNGGSAISYIPETAWNDTAVTGGLAASGGGLSAVYAKPSWQAGPGVPADGVRDVPDVALDASNAHDPYLVLSEGVALEVGGTSAAAPTFAGILAVLNQFLVANQVESTAGLGNINPKLYSMAASGPAGVFHDVTTGSNMVPCQSGTPNCANGQFGFEAGPGYDLVTGLGSVDAFRFITAWAGIPVAGTTTTLAVNPATVAPGGSAVLTATVTASSGARTPTGAVVFSVAGNLVGSAPLSGTGATATASLTVFGAQLLAASNAVEASYGGSALFTASSASGTLGLGAPSAVAAVTVTVTPNPVVQQAPNANGATFVFTVKLQETAGVATTLTGFTFDGMSFGGSLAAFFGSTTLPAHGTLSANLQAGNIPVPAMIPLVFTGHDASGALWTAQTVVSFVGPAGN